MCISAIQVTSFMEVRLPEGEAALPHAVKWTSGGAWQPQEVPWGQRGGVCVKGKVCGGRWGRGGLPRQLRWACPRCPGRGTGRGCRRCRAGGWRAPG